MPCRPGTRTRLRALVDCDTGCIGPHTCKCSNMTVAVRQVERSFRQPNATARCAVQVPRSLSASLRQPYADLLALIGSRGPLSALPAPFRAASFGDSALSADMGFSDLPDALVAQVLSHLPLQDRIGASAVCRQWQRASAVPSAAWAEFEWRCASLAQWHGLMRWLRPRMPGLRRLRLQLVAALHMRRRQRESRSDTALRVLGARLATAAQLRELSLRWDVAPCGCAEAGGNGNDARPCAPPLPTALLLPAPSRTARRAGRPLPLQLTRLELSCTSGVELCPALGLLTSLRRLTVGVHKDHWGTGGPLLAGPAKPSPAVPPAAPPLWLPPALASLTLATPVAVASLAACGPALPASLPALRELRLGWCCDFPLAELGPLAGAAGKLLEVLLPLAGQLESLELPPGCLPPPVLVRFTALHTLQAHSQPAESGHAAFREVWDGVLFHLSRLRCLDIQLVLGSAGYDTDTQPLEFPLPLAALPASLRELRLGTLPGVEVPLPAGEYLRGLTCLAVLASTSLRLAPLLPFMPELAHLEVCNSFETGRAHHPPSSGSGDAALDAAAAAAAALDTTPGAGAEGRLALALARCPRFRSFRVVASEEDWWAHGAAAAVALRLQRLRPDVDVHMGPASGGASGEECW
ncbi:hypothetical protein ABPG75_012129 [Micractinium tetrahymenae]